MNGLAGQTSFYPPEPAPDPLLCWLWLAHVLGPASPHAGRVLDTFGGAQEAWEARDTAEFRQAAGPAAAKRAGQLVPEQFRALARRCAALRVCILPFDDPDYPLAFSRIPDMPLVLYCTGDPVWLNEPGAVGIVGSRKPTDYGLQAAADIGEALARSGALIVSGLADGLDSAGHRAAVKNGCPTIGILGVPIDRTYPAANVALRHTIEQNGCILSEYAPGESTPGPVGFLQRNRLIAALSSALLVVEAREKSGTCPPCPTRNGTASRCLRCRAASIPRIRPGPTACCTRAAPAQPAAGPTWCRRWACRRVPRRKQRSASRTP